MALNAPAMFRSLMRKGAAYPIIWDLGATHSVTFDRKDFIGPLKKPSALLRLSDMAQGLRIEGVGNVLWSIEDAEGQLRMLKLPAYYVPKCNVCLLGTISCLQKYKGESIHQDDSGLRLSGVPSDLMRGTIVTPINPKNNLPTSWAYNYGEMGDEAMQIEQAFANVVEQCNDNLSNVEKELL